ncbi:hypothetical protein Murru_1992 [Allomuricauda ruestringensis DSM 13258]|uniref:Uncharacterized protein n=1 Tax=Allomuricauda ruestringensis (strain DSM 13258 / CIP 107369 / LMG 19739 / B1) TaxID=886377 RepID=G2PL02_ALLRU|nr:hypothetical protein [Allomuricauda ruestringensis]AEM71031.1 hypothetical protein Murru_1992 [Allomuricauda ruestringensis DSM 13258]
MDKLEKHIKGKLEERTIAPSANAWDKIASQVKEPSPRKKNTWFPYAIAASVMGIVLVSVFFFTKSNPEVEQIQVVDTETKTETQTQFEDRKVKELVKDEQTEVAETKSERITPEKTEEFVPKTPVSNTAIAEREVRQPLKDEIIINSDKLIAQKVEEVVAQVELMEISQQDVTDAEVDSLLRAAQRQILTDKLFSKSGSVDAMSLLAEVEDELDESFRDQIFDALKTGYFKLRTAVADRNQ